MDLLHEHFVSPYYVQVTVQSAEDTKVKSRV